MSREASRIRCGARRESSSWRPSRKSATERTCSSYQARVDVDHARRGAALDLVLEARAPPRRELGVGARAELEVLVDEVERAPRAVAEWYGPLREPRHGEQERARRIRPGLR